MSDTGITRPSSLKTMCLGISRLAKPVVRSLPYSILLAHTRLRQASVLGWSDAMASLHGKREGKRYGKRYGKP
jgi:hypothetical protein